MLEIRADLRQEYGILNSARRTSDMRRKAKQGQHCFVAHNVTCQTDLEKSICTWESKARVEKDKGLIPRKVLALSPQHQDFYHEQKNYYQCIANAYTEWYNHQQEISQQSNSVYFYCDPWEVDFELSPGTLETPLNGFFNET